MLRLTVETGGAGSYGLRMRMREALELSGVTAADSFDEEAVRLQTLGGILLIQGAGLHVDRLDLEKGEVTLSGRVDSLEYLNDEPRTGSLWGKLFH